MMRVKPFKRDNPREVKDLRDMVLTSAAIFGEKPLYVYKEDKKELEYSYNRLRDETEQFGTALDELGIRGAHVAVVSETSAKVTVTYLGTVNSTGVIVPLDREISHDQLINFLNRAECSMVVYSPTFKGVFTEKASELPGVKYYVPMSGDDEVDETLPSSPKVILWDELLSIGEKALNSGNRSYGLGTLDQERLCAILFTSGTTGTSKGVMLCMRNLVAATWASCLAVPYDSKTRLVSVLPMHHTYEMTCGHLAAINLGITIYLNESIKYATRNFQYFKPNALVLVPLFLETAYKKIWDNIRKKGIEKKVRNAMKLSDFLLKFGIDLRRKLFADIHEVFGGNLQSCISGGAPINPQILRDYFSWGITVFEGYGITECAPLLSVNPGNIHVPNFGSVGKAVDKCRVRIDRDPADEYGEIVVKGENVMMGYYKDEEATKKAFTHDMRNFDNNHWFRTGDLGYIDRDGYIYITGRAKNLIILSNGKNVFPEELEEHLSHSQLITESIVVGRKHDNSEIVITALVYPNYDMLSGKTDEEVETIIKDEVNNINRNLPSYKHITATEIFKTEFEKTTTKKIKRFMYM